MRAASESLSPDSSGGTPRPSHRGVSLLDAGSHRRRQLQSLCELAGSSAVVGHLLRHRFAASRHYPRRLAAAVQRRCTRAGSAEHEPHGRKASQVDLDGVGAKVDVVTKQNRRLVPIYRTAHIGEEADVKKGGQFACASPRPVADPACRIRADLSMCSAGCPKPRSVANDSATQYLAEAHAGISHSRNATRGRHPLFSDGQGGECLMTAAGLIRTLSSEELR